MSRSAKDIVTNEVKLGLGAQNTNMRRNTVLHRFNKLGIGLKKIRNGTTPNQKHMGEKWPPKPPAQPSQARKENKPQTKKKKKLRLKQKTSTPKTKIQGAKNKCLKCKDKALVSALNK